MNKKKNNDNSYNYTYIFIVHKTIIMYNMQLAGTNNNCRENRYKLTL